MDLITGIADKQGAVINNCKLFRVKLPTSQTLKHRHKLTLEEDLHFCCARFYFISNKLLVHMLFWAILYYFIWLLSPHVTTVTKHCGVISRSSPLLTIQSMHPKNFKLADSAGVWYWMCLKELQDIGFNDRNLVCSKTWAEDSPTPDI